MSVAEYDDDRAPLLDSSVLLRLREELDGDEGVWKVFIQNFVAHLPARTEKLRLALTTGDSTGAMVAVLSLKTSSQMVGAERLAGLAMALEGEIRSEAYAADVTVVLPRLAASFLRPIDQCSRQTMHRLQAQCSTGASR